MGNIIFGKNTKFRESYRVQSVRGGGINFLSNDLCLFHKKKVIEYHSEYFCALKII